MAEGASLKTKYSVWLEFPGYRSVVEELAEAAGNPAFCPHMTLIGHLERPAKDIAGLLKPLTRRTPPVKVNFYEFATKFEEWRFLCLASRRTAPLQQLFREIHGLFPEAAGEDFRRWPHLSLAYGTPAAQKLWPAPLMLGEQLGSRLLGPRYSDRLAVWDTSGPVETWQRVQLMPLTSS